MITMERSRKVWSQKTRQLAFRQQVFILTRLLTEDYRSATTFVTFSLSPPSLSLTPNLRFIQLLTSGHDHMRGTPLLSDPSIPAATCSGVSARSIAQYVVLQVLSWAHQYPRVLGIMDQRKWVGPEKHGRGYPMANVLAGRRVGIWGYGSIGRQCNVPFSFFCENLPVLCAPH